VLNKLVNLVLSYKFSPNFFCKIFDNMTRGRYCPINKVINSLNKSLLLLNSKALVPERISVSPGLSEAANASRNSKTRAFEVVSCLSIITKLSSPDCINCLINTTRFVDSSHVFGVFGNGGISVFLGGACFCTGLRLKRALLQRNGYVYVSSI
jgi:hypothetical protein